MGVMSNPLLLSSSSCAGICDAGLLDEMSDGSVAAGRGPRPRARSRLLATALQDLVGGELDQSPSSKIRPVCAPSIDRT